MSNSVLHVGNWKFDQIYWRNYGCKRLKTTPILFKNYYVFVNPDGTDNPGFKRFSYHLHNKSNDLTVVHYKGNHTLADQYEDAKWQTCPSVLREWEKSEQSPSVLYKKNICNNQFISLEYHSIFSPQNQKQISNLQARHRQKLRISHDALYNLHELSYNLENFVHKIITYPDLIVICGLKPMLKEVNRLFKMPLTPTSVQLFVL